ncbi:MAG: sigma-70 family RNA polymerase sigma factor [Actinomycetota bacterium]|nr:sigma-70 family RNA polymerase sigma factor [Actinomycetota bacterium]
MTRTPGPLPSVSPSERAGAEREPLTALDERELMRRLAAGDEDAIRTVYARFARPVFGMGLRMLGAAEAAEELTQDVFLAAWRKAGRYDPARGRLSTWLMTIAHNLAVDRLRSARYRGHQALVALDEVPDAGMSDEEGMLDRDTARRALAGLSEAERRLVRLAYESGYTAREIAQAGGIPIGTVKTRLRAALIKVRRLHREKEA